MNDSRLIRRCQNGEKEAFNELISIYYPYVFKFLLKLTGSKEKTEDITQDTFIKMIRNIDKFNFKDASFRTYIITVAKNTYIDYIRKNSSELQEFDIDTFGDVYYDESLYNKLSYDEVLRCIDKLPILQKEVVRLKYLEGYTLNEIAERQNTKVKTVKSRLFEARKKLRSIIKGDDEIEN